MASSDRSRLRRRFTLLDCAVLIAATGLGLALLRVCLDGLISRTPSRTPQAPLQILITSTLTGMSAVLSCWTLALLALGLLPPRAPIRRLARRPGFAACAVATAGIAVYLTVCAIQVTRGRLVLDAASASRIVGSFEIHASLMVAGAWLSLLLSGRWKPETTWVGWAGRCAGVTWIALLFLGYVRAFI